MAMTKNSKRKSKNRSNKINLVFDETKRRDFLTGFRKRKLQRKKQAQEKLEKELKEERKRLKAEAKESYKKLVVSHRDIPELQDLLSNEYEEDDVTVKVTELSANDIAKQNSWIGANRPKYESDEEICDNDDERDSERDNKVPGMELNVTSAKKEEKGPINKEFHSEKQIKKELKKQATKNVQKSKVFQKKNKLERQKQKKQSFKAKKQKDQNMHKFNKRKGNKTRRNKD